MSKCTQSHSLRTNRRRDRKNAKNSTAPISKSPPRRYCRLNVRLSSHLARVRRSLVARDCLKWPGRAAEILSAAQARCSRRRRASPQGLLIISREFCSRRRCLLRRKHAWDPGSVEPVANESGNAYISGRFGDARLRPNVEFHGAVSDASLVKEAEATTLALLRPSSWTWPCAVSNAHSCVFQRIGCDTRLFLRNPSDWFQPGTA